MIFTLMSAWAVATSAAVAAQAPSAHQVEHQLVAVGRGRKMALSCTGNGKYTVLFEAGGSDWSLIWAPILPKIAALGRACAYDRAGLGSSDAGPGARTPAAIAEDMRSLIEAAKLKTPLVLVGHSFGGFNAKLYTALYPETVAGLVLIDPSDERLWDRTRAWAITTYGRKIAARAELADHAFISALRERYRRCAQLADPKGLDQSSLDYRRCSDPPRPQLSSEVNALRAQIQATAKYQTAQASEIAYSVYADDTADEAYAALFRPGMLGAKPVIVLTHQDEDSDDPIDQLGTAQGLKLHREAARLSTKGKHQLVPKSGHYIQLDQPEIVVRAIEDVIRQLP